MNAPKKLAAVVAAGALMVGLAACGDDNGNTDPQAKQTASNGDVFNAADVHFTTSMIQHHAQALSMVDLTRGRRDLGPEVTRLADTILAARAPEIEEMVDWLTDWDKPVPETIRDHTNADNDGMSGHHMDDGTGSEMPGMMSDEEMAELEAAQGEEFETMWLQMMIEHHEGAIDMAREEQEVGAFEPSVNLAKSIEASQQAEIDDMKTLLSS